MNKWYFGVPVILLVAFSLYYVQFSKADDEREAEKVRIAEQARQAKIEEERQLRIRAVEEAKALIEQRRAEQAQKKADKEAADARREEERLALERAKTENSQLKVELKDVSDELADEERLLKLALEQKRAHEAEREFVIGYTDAARQNRDRFLKLIDKIEESDQAKAAAAAAAAKK